jgi:hypothetical protein
MAPSTLIQEETKLETSEAMNIHNPTTNPHSSPTLAINLLI